MTQPPLPQPQSDRTAITFEQYDEYTPQKLELWDGFYNSRFPDRCFLSNNLNQKKYLPMETPPRAIALGKTKNHRI